MASSYVLLCSYVLLQSYALATVHSTQKHRSEVLTYVITTYEFLSF